MQFMHTKLRQPYISQMHKEKTLNRQQKPVPLYNIINSIRGQYKGHYDPNV